MNKWMETALEEIERRGLVDDFNRYAERIAAPMPVIVARYEKSMPLRFLPVDAAESYKQLEILYDLNRNPWDSWNPDFKDRYSKRHKRILRMYHAFKRKECAAL